MHELPVPVTNVACVFKGFVLADRHFADSAIDFWQVYHSMVTGMTETGNRFMDIQIPDERRRALIAGVCTGDPHDFEVGMEELVNLTYSCGMEPVRKVTQHLPWTDRATCAGPGKVEEIRSLADAEEADLVIFNNHLSPAQISNLTKLLDVEVLDRTALILQIFAEHASTKEARAQVEYARLRYMLPRLAGLRRNLSRQGGGSGSLSNKGSGEMQIELDRRHIERRMTVLRRELKKIALNRETQRRRRMRNRIPLVSLVGYTNAGKSTLMNALIDYCSKDSPAQIRLEENDRHVFVKDMVFATLDTAVRRIEPEGETPFLLSDTVGFINDLPTFLVEAFHSTLEEVLQADLILEIVDASDPEHAMQMEVTSRTLQEMGAGGIPRIIVMNKADLTGDRAGHPAPDRIRISARNGDGVGDLIRMIEEKLSGDTVQVTVLLPYDKLSVSDMLRRRAVILREEYVPEGLRLDVRMNLGMLNSCRDYIV